MAIKILRWIYYGVVLSITPFTLVIVRNWISGNNVSTIDYFLDLLLITFAIAVNALSIVTDRTKQIWEVMRTICKILSSFSVIICIAMYFSFFEYCVLNDKLLDQFMKIDVSVENMLLNKDSLQEFEMLKNLVEELSPKNEQLIFFIIVSVVILVINSLIGVAVEIVDECKVRGQNKSQGKGNGNAIQNNMQEQL